MLTVTPPRERRRYGGTVWSLLAHLALIAALFWTIDRDFASVVERGAPLIARRGGGGGGGGGEYVALPALPAPAPRPVAPLLIPKPQPVPVQTVPLTIPEAVPPPADTASPAPAATVSAATGGPGTGPGTGGGAGGGAGTGVGPGNGSGVGPGNGLGGGGQRPRQRRIEIPWGDTPKELRGGSISVLFLVAPDGKPLRITVTPEIRDKGFARKFLDAMRNAEFFPARAPDGLPIGDTITIVWSF